MTLSIVHVLTGLYIGVTLVLLGWFVGDEMNYRNPRYRQAIAVAVGWPILLLFAALLRVAWGGSA